MKLAIIGAGPAGLEVLRHAIDQNFECTVFEQSDKIGGTWNYSDYVEEDEYGLPVHSSMYQGLVTNLPKEIMAFDNFPYTEPENSFITQPEVLKYIHKFAKHFNLIPHIKFRTQVVCVNVFQEEIHNGIITKQDKWHIITKNLKTDEISESVFDAVCVCNGHYFDPWYPSIPGMECWADRSIHSHVFRKIDSFKDKKVLVIGAGPSGVDISRMVAKVAEKVIISFGGNPLGAIDQSVIKKPRVNHFTETTAVFNDGSQETIDQIIYCTGYNTVFPFLTKKCGIEVDNSWIKPLYKHVINIEHPTMAIINITNVVSRFPVTGIQARFFLAFLKGKFTKTKQEMLDDLKRDREARDKQGQPVEYAHSLGSGNGRYMEDLATTAGIEKLDGYVLRYLEKYL